MTTFVGNISKAASTRTVKVAGVDTLVTDFNVAENYRGANGEQKTQFYRVSIWRNGAKLEKYLTLGRPVQIVGRVRGRAYIDKTGQPACQLEIANPQITFIGANPVKEEQPEELPFDEEIAE